MPHKMCPAVAKADTRAPIRVYVLAASEARLYFGADAAQVETQRARRPGGISFADSDQSRSPAGSGGRASLARRRAALSRPLSTHRRRPLAGGGPGVLRRGKLGTHRGVQPLRARR